MAPDCWGEDSAVALSASDCSSGIWTLSLGLFAFDCAVLVRDGGRNSEELDLRGAGPSFWGLAGGGIDFEFWVGGASASTSRSRLMSGLDSFAGLEIPQC